MASVTRILFGIAAVLVVNVLLFTYVHCKTKYRLYRVELTILAQILMVYLDRFIWRKLSHLCTDKLHLQNLWKLSLVAFIVLMHTCPLYTFINAKEPSLLGWVAWVCTGAAVIFFTTVFLSDITLMMLKRMGIVSPHADDNLVQNTKNWLCLLIGILCTSAAYNNATSPPVVLRQEIPIAKLPPSMSGLRIALLSDIHLGPTVGFTMMDNAVKITNSLKADIVVLAGDLTDGTVDELREAALPLKDLKAPLGKYFVTGNHEYYTSDVENWFQFMESAGFHILHNSNIWIHSPVNKNDCFCLLGIDDRQADIIRYDNHGVNLTKAFTGCDEKYSAILIAHQPNDAKKALDSGLPIQLVLSGHTHRGQLFPFTIPVYLASAFFAGLYRYNDVSYVYVSQGTYYYGWPMRMFSHNEISEITLVSA